MEMEVEVGNSVANNLKGKQKQRRVLDNRSIDQKRKEDDVRVRSRSLMLKLV